MFMNSNDDSPTETEYDQRSTEKTLARRYLNNAPPEGCKVSLLARNRHISWLSERLSETSSQHLDSSRPWLVYWPLHALDLMSAASRVLSTRVSVGSSSSSSSSSTTTSTNASTTMAEALFNWIFKCWTYIEDTDDRKDQRHPSTQKTTMGGFCGGWGFQAPHLASCWAACASLIILCDELPKLRPLLKDRLDREALTNWLCSLRTEEGGFTMFNRGEVDLRASYCAACIATVFDLDAGKIFPVECMKFIGRCQSLDGGISSTIHGAEGHGGYVSCGFLGLLLMHCLRENQQRRRASAAARNKNNKKQVEQESSSSSSSSILSSDYISQHYCLDVHQLRRWCALRQDPCVGAFSGRVNKLVDSCYSWWVGGTMSALALVDAAEDVVSSSLAELDENNTERDDDDEEEIPESMKRVMKLRSLNLTQHALLFPQEVTKKLLKEKILVSTSDEDKNTNNAQSKNINVQNENKNDDDNNINVIDDETPADATTTTCWLDETLDDGGDYAYNQDRLAEYVLELAQTRFGGLCDKPDLNPDLYHTCYSLSGLSISVGDKEVETRKEFLEEMLKEDGQTDENKLLDELLKEAYQFQHFDATESLKQTPTLQTTHPLLNLTRKRVKFALEFFGGRDSLL